MVSKAVIEANNFLRQYKQAYEFAQAVAGMGSLEDQVGVLNAQKTAVEKARDEAKAELEGLAKDLAAAKQDVLNATGMAHDIRLGGERDRAKIIAEAEAKAAEIISDAKAVAAEQQAKIERVGKALKELS